MKKYKRLKRSLPSVLAAQPVMMGTAWRRSHLSLTQNDIIHVCLRLFYTSFFLQLPPLPLLTRGLLVSAVCFKGFIQKKMFPLRFLSFIYYPKIRKWEDARIPAPLIRSEPQRWSILSLFYTCHVRHMVPGVLRDPVHQRRKSKSSWEEGLNLIVLLYTSWCVSTVRWKEQGGTFGMQRAVPFGDVPFLKGSWYWSLWQRGCGPVNIASFRWATFATATTVALVLDLKSPLFLKNTRTKSQRWGVKGKLDILICAPARKTLCGENRQWRRLFTTMCSSSAARREQLYWRRSSKGRNWQTNPHPAENRDREKIWLKTKNNNIKSNNNNNSTFPER